MAVYRSNKYMEVQVVDDDAGRTLFSAKMDDAKETAEETAEGGTTKATMDADPGLTGTEAAGTEDIPVRHAGERKEMVARHEEEMAQMHKRHAKEHRKMNRRHMSEIGTEQESPEEDAGEAEEE